MGVEIEKSIRRIYMVSSAVLSASSFVFGWTAPLGAAFGLAVNLSEDKRAPLAKEFKGAVEAAYSRVKNSITSGSNRIILNELFVEEIAPPDNLSDLIRKTEAYQVQYCTEKNVTEIVNIFDMHFREEIANRPSLSNLYVLSTGFVSLEQLKKINDILHSDSKKLDSLGEDIVSVKEELSSLNSHAISLSSAFKTVSDGLVSVLASMAVFLAYSLFLFPVHYILFLVIAPISYGISYIFSVASDKGFLSRSLRSVRKVFTKGSMSVDNPNITSSPILSIVYPYVVSFFVSIACFLIFSYALFLDSETSILISTLGIALGNLVGSLLRYMGRNLNNDKVNLVEPPYDSPSQKNIIRNYEIKSHLDCVDMPTLIQMAKHDLFLSISINNAHILSSLESVILHRGDIQFRILLLNNYDNYESHDYRRNINSPDIYSVLKRFENNRNIEIRKFDSLVSVMFSAIDLLKDVNNINKFIRVEHVYSYANYFNLPIIEVAPGAKWYRVYAEEIESVWQRGMPFHSVDFSQ